MKREGNEEEESCQEGRNEKKKILIFLLKFIFTILIRYVKYNLF